MKMKQKKVLYLILILVVLGTGAYFVNYYFVSEPYVALEENAVYSTDPLIPNTLIIPKLKIEAPVEHLGKNAAGNMAVPKKYDEVSWYSPGFAPGEKGNAAIAGHVDNSLGLHGVFYNLHTLVVGDDVYIRDESGKTSHFKVVDIKRYEYNSAPLGEIFGTSDKKRLNLITCIGEWDASVKSYRERLIVHTELVE